MLLGNINDLVRVIGNKRLWITEYGYQTRPERLYGVSFQQQAQYVAQSFAIARRHPRIDMMLCSCSATIRGSLQAGNPASSS